jgi:lipoprotein signal peptidase
MAVIALAVVLLDQATKLLVLRLLGPTQERVVVEGFFQVRGLGQHRRGLESVSRPE